MMKFMNQYGTPRERIDDSFRARVENGADTGIRTAAARSGGMRDLGGYPQAMVYAPEATFENIYGDEEGFSRGTIFSDLYFPFECSSCRGNGGMA